MKKIFYVFFALIFWLSFFGYSLAWNISQENKSKVDSIMAIVERDRWKEFIPNQISKYEKFIKAFSIASTKNQEQKEMVNYIVDCFKKKLNELNSMITTQNEVIANVDWNQVESAWLSWHNEEREKFWLEPYTINETLNYSSLIRAQQLASTNKKSYTHTRSQWDWYYNYNSIKNRFSNLGIVFNYEWTAFSESNAYQYYTCKKTDCTQEIISVLKKCFDWVLKDRTHYPAVISKVYDQIWFWVAINGKYVRVTTHYWINVNK